MDTQARVDLFAYLKRLGSIFSLCFRSPSLFKSTSKLFFSHLRAFVIDNMAPSAIQPNISYEPDFEKYQNRTKRRLASEDTSQALPDGFPQQLKSDLVWDASDFPQVGSGNEPWVYN